MVAKVVAKVPKLVVSTSAVWPWMVRLAWVAVGVCAQRSLSLALGATVNTAGTVVPASGATAVKIIAAVFWIVGAFTIAIPAVTSLTAARTVIPTSLAAVVPVAWAVGLTNAWIIATVATTIAATVTVFNADLGRVYVQASAYGEEDRHLLRAPAAYLLAASVTWLVWASAGVAGTVAVARGRWLFGVVLGLVAVGVFAWGWRRWHRLSRRWLVFVPVGVVVHDHLVLAETWLVRRQELVGLRLAPADTGAADLTGPATGHAVEIVLAETLTVLLAGSPSRPSGKAIHLTAALVAPSRPGAALRHAATRRLTVPTA